MLSTSVIAAVYARPIVFDLGCGRKIERGVRERIEALGHADEVHALLRRDRKRQRVRVGKPDVFACENHHRRAMKSGSSPLSIMRAR